MPANFNRKILDLKRWVLMPTPLPTPTVGGSLVVSSRLHQQRQLHIFSSILQYLYYPFEDGYVQIPSGALAGTFGGGTCGTSGAIGPTGTATGGSDSTVSTNLPLARSLAGYQIEITAGPAAGESRVIAFNTVGANSVITTTTPFSVPITAASSYRLITPRYYVLNGGSLVAGSFRLYCFALNTWTTLSQLNLPPTWGTDARLMATPSYTDNGAPTFFAEGTATAGAASTLTNSAKAWTPNQWTNSQVRITSGLGAGQIRTIASNTGTVLTVSTPWTIVPNATSQYKIEGNDDHLYLIGNNSVAAYRYSISANTWTLIAPTAARAGAPTTGLSGNWVYNVPSSRDPRWADENNIINGRRLYSFRGGGSSALDYYDIASNTWISNVAYAPGAETLNQGTKYAYADGYLYLTKEGTGRWFRFCFAENAMVGWTTNVFPSGPGIVGDTAYDILEPETGVRYIQYALNTSNAVMRCMVV